MTVTRALSEKDIPKLAAMEQICFSDAWTAETLAEEMAREGFVGLLAEENDAAIGFAYGNALFENAELYKIAVLPDCRKKGVGKALLDAFTDAVKAMDARQIFLEVRVGNVAARALYAGQGFVVNRVRRRYYADGEDCLEMRKGLYPDEE